MPIPQSDLGDFLHFTSFPSGTTLVSTPDILPTILILPFGPTLALLPFQPRLHDLVTLVVGKVEYIVQIDHYANIDKIVEDVVHEELKGCRSICDLEHKVEIIADSRPIAEWPQEIEYLIKWTGYDAAFNSWVSWEGMVGSLDMLKQWHQEHPRKCQPTPAQVRRLESLAQDADTTLTNIPFHHFPKSTIHMSRFNSTLQQLNILI
ncbi:hypothetical protein BDP27DRAFT_1431657 [Rhodocollybia butyracea]|uniref:Chromo domain-containing protein n=1 Tax=Rhodocollybia butyracea TaxID=206335 RepID=A0A9P5P9T2_9AGAR|nr:hypothetical protein BDP27DRAFT_1431657 [Rhodocollybia butyracea]